MGFVRGYVLLGLIIAMAGTTAFPVPRRPAKPSEDGGSCSVRIARAVSVLVDLSGAEDGKKRGTKSALVEIQAPEPTEEPSEELVRDVKLALEGREVSVKRYLVTAQTFVVEIVPEVAREIVETANSKSPGVFSAIAAIRPNTRHGGGGGRSRSRRKPTP